MHGEESEVKLSRNPPFDRTLLIKTPMDKALFINDSSAKGAIKGRLKMNNKKNKKRYLYIIIFTNKFTTNIYLI